MMDFNQNYIKTKILDTISLLKSKSDQYRRSNSAGLNPNHRRFDSRGLIALAYKIGWLVKTFTKSTTKVQPTNTTTTTGSIILSFFANSISPTKWHQLNPKNDRISKKRTQDHPN